jgi:hypothetical protein
MPAPQAALEIGGIHEQSAIAQFIFERFRGRGRRSLRKRVACFLCNGRSHCRHTRGFRRKETVIFGYGLPDTNSAAAAFEHLHCKRHTGFQPLHSLFLVFNISNNLASLLFGQG